MDVKLPLPNPEDWVAPAYVLAEFDISQQTLWRWAGGNTDPDGKPRYPIKLTRYFPIGGTDPMYWKPEVDSLREAMARAGSYRWRKQ